MPTPLTGLQGVELFSAVPGHADYDSEAADFAIASAIWQGISILPEAVNDASAESVGVAVGAQYNNSGTPNIRSV